MHWHRLVTLSFPCIALTGCFEPGENGGGTETEGGSDGTTGSTTASSTTTASTTDGTSASTTATTNDTTASTTADTSAGTSADTGVDGSGDTSNGTDTSSGSTGADPFCGDGIQDDGEECDDGMNNAPGNACLEGCIANVCGDGDVLEGTEACDDGAKNALELGACAPNCSKVIDAKIITGSSNVANGDFGNNPVAFADAQCEPGYSALFVYPDVREATTTPYEVVDPIDWVLQPYTAYTRSNGTTVVWITDDVALLGVRDGASMPLVNPVFGCAQFCIISRKVTGLDNDWTTSVDSTCNGWTDGTANSTAVYGNPYDAAVYLDAGESECLWSYTGFYCVEQ